MNENDAFTVPMGMDDRNTIFGHVMYSHMASVSHAQTNSLDPNHQNQIMAEFPALSLLQGESMSNLNTSFSMSNHIGIVDCDRSITRNAPLGRNPMTDPSSSSLSYSNREVEERFMGGTPIAALSLATLLAARYGPHDELNELATSAPSVSPMEILKTPSSNDYSHALNSAFASSMNCGIDGILCSMNNKWDFDKLLTRQENAGKVLGRPVSQPFLMGDNNPSVWISADNTHVSSDYRCGSSKFCNELSLSLGTYHPSMIHGTGIPDKCSEISRSCVTQHSFNEKQFGMEASCNDKNLSLSFGSCNSMQLSQLLSGSRYLHEIQQILAAMTRYSLEDLDQMNYPASRIGAGANLPFSSSCSGDKDLVLQGREVEAKKHQLLALLKAVDERYNQCLDEIHTVISAFHAATELDPSIHARFVLQTTSFLYKNLRERISNQILAMGEFSNKEDTGEEQRPFAMSFIKKQWAVQQLKRKDQHLWRPQRGLPERSVSVLRAWMFQNFLHPYPKDAEKHLLAVKSGLTRSQVSNWFINARVRLWKPMIEEMYAEMNRRKGRGNDEETSSRHRSGVSVDRRRLLI